MLGADGSKLGWWGGAGRIREEWFTGGGLFIGEGIKTDPGWAGEEV